MGAIIKVEDRGVRQFGESGLHLRDPAGCSRRIVDRVDRGGDGRRGVGGR